MTLADLLLKIASFLFGQKHVYQKEKQEKTLRLADYLTGIAEALTKTSDRLAKKELPVDDCQELQVHLANLKIVLAPALCSSSELNDHIIVRLESELYAAIESPIRVVAMLQSSRWALLGCYMDAGAPVVIGTVKTGDAELPVQLSSTNDFPEKIDQLKGRSDYRITIDPEAAITRELSKIRQAAGLFRGLAKTIRGLA